VKPRTPTKPLVYLIISNKYKETSFQPGFPRSWWLYVIIEDS